MIKSLEMTHFKCFDTLKLGFSPLTLLTGFNSGGKSTAIQPLLLLAQGLRSSSFPTKRFPLNGSLVRLGSAGDVLPVSTSTTEVVFSVEAHNEVRMWSLEAKAGERALRFIGTEAELVDECADPDTPHGSVIRSLMHLQYLSATRQGTSEWFAVPDGDARTIRNVGVLGEFACFEYDRAADDEVPVARRHPRESATSVRKQVDAWMSELFPGAQASVQSYPQVSMHGIQFRTSDTGDWRRPANVGYGLSYVFPIVTALVTARIGQTLIIDSPEAHLHPSAQSAMGRLLSHFAASGVQVVVETHSDHLLNGVRLAVREKAISPGDVAVHFFSGAGGDGHGVASPAVDAEGQIHEWPDGFFDQAEKDLVQMAGWR